jgi:hypothetical protein
MVATLVAGVGLLGSGAPAMAKTTGKQRFLVILSSPDENAAGRVIATGPISGVGTSQTVSSGEGKRHTDKEEMTFPKGKVFITDTATDTFSFDPRSCIGTFTSKGPYKITGGTGAFTGAKGSGTFQVQGHVVGPRQADGTCAPPESGQQPVSFTGSVRANGTTTLP